ncbi:MAG: non-homologous end-joining DNA ligase [Wenzhouxiangellaceae bacterium]|nr:non-homologous end-joining DNA ligase [Wenzhouxiangellaceae bacterium]
MSDWADSLSSKDRRKLKESSPPDWFEPMLATLTHKHFSDPDWIFERKLDGERILAFRDGNKVRLMTRNKKCANDTYPEIVEACRAVKTSQFVVDGEVVALKNNISSFERLQQRMKLSDPEQAKNSSVAVYFYVFDLPYLEGYILDALPLRQRKSLLRRALDFNKTLRFTPHRNEAGEAYFKAACKKGWEGVMAKRADSHYRHSRSTDWLKFKCSRGQELVIAGFTEPEGERVGFGALLVGYYDDDQLRYAGKVGTGYDDEFLENFRERMERHASDDCPFTEKPREKNVTWVKPRFVGEFGFTEWTRDGKLRHPRFLGLRRDKDPTDVVREDPD